MPSPRIAIRGVFIHKGAILLCECADNRGTFYLTPGGGVEKGETLEEAFAREMHEEIGERPPFGDVLFIREYIRERHEKPTQPPSDFYGFHQIEISVKSTLQDPENVQPAEPDSYQTGLRWVPLAELDQVRFYPKSLTKNFQEQNWPQVICGECD